MSECKGVCPEHCPIPEDVVNAKIVEDPIMEFVNTTPEHGMSYTPPPILGPCTCYRNLNFLPEDHARYCPVWKWSVGEVHRYVDAQDKYLKDSTS